VKQTRLGLPYTSWRTLSSTLARTHPPWGARDGLHPARPLQAPYVALRSTIGPWAPHGPRCWARCWRLRWRARRRSRARSTPRATTATPPARRRLGGPRAAARRRRRRRRACRCGGAGLAGPRAGPLAAGRGSGGGVGRRRRSLSVGPRRPRSSPPTSRCTPFTTCVSAPWAPWGGAAGRRGARSRAQPAAPHRNGHVRSCAAPAPARTPPSDPLTPTNPSDHQGYGDPKTDGRYIHWCHAVLPHWDERQRGNFPTGAAAALGGGLGPCVVGALGPCVVLETLGPEESGVMGSWQRGAAKGQRRGGRLRARTPGRRRQLRRAAVAPPPPPAPPCRPQVSAAPQRALPILPLVG
jgi:hypothetical protein